MHTLNKSSACILTGTLILENKKAWQCCHLGRSDASEIKRRLCCL